MVYDVPTQAAMYIRIRELEEQVDKLERELTAKITKLENDIKEQHHEQTKIN